MHPEDSPQAYAFETLTVAGTAVGGTAATYNTGLPVLRVVMGPLEAAQIRYRYDGTNPTASVGHLLEVGDVLILEGPTNIAQFRGIRTGGVSGSLPITYER